MELRQLGYLVALAEERNFTRAAEREHIAQPALSQQIRRLENELGLALVERTTRHVAMTDAGLAAVARARRLLRELLMAAGNHAGFVPEIKLESNESQRIRRLVSRGMGVAILPRSDTSDPGAEVGNATLTEPSLHRDITLAWREGRRHSPAAS